MGVASAGLSVSVMIFSPLTRVLINTYGWRGALLLITGHSLQLLVPAALFRPARKKPVRVEEPDTSDTSTREDASVKSPTSRCLKSVSSAMMSYFHPALGNRSFILLLAACFTLMFGVDTIYMRSAARAILEGIDELQAAFIVSFSSPFSVLGRVTCGLLARLVNPRNVYGAGFVSMGASVILSAFLAFNVFGLHVFFCAWFAISVGKSSLYIRLISHLCMIKYNSIHVAILLCDTFMISIVIKSIFLRPTTECIMMLNLFWLYFRYYYGFTVDSSM